MVDKIIHEKERQIKYSDRKQINLFNLLSILRIVYYLCMIFGIMFVASVSVNLIHPLSEKNNIVDTDNVYVYDGDTIAIGNEKIRVLCIDTPEVANEHKGTKAEPYSDEARTTMIEFVENNEQIIKQCQGRDKYGRELCELYGEDGNNIGLAMVRYGEAKVFLCSKKEYYQAQAEAKKKHRGMWSGEHI